MDLAWLEKLGVAGGSLAVLYLVITKILNDSKNTFKSIMEQSEHILKQANDERQVFIETIAKTEEAHKYQRDEHKKLQESLDRIIESLTEVCIVLRRMNGYKQK